MKYSIVGFSNIQEFNNLSAEFWCNNENHEENKDKEINKKDLELLSFFLKKFDLLKYGISNSLNEKIKKFILGERISFSKEEHKQKNIVLNSILENTYIEKLTKDKINELEKILIKLKSFEK